MKITRKIRQFKLRFPLENSQVWFDEYHDDVLIHTSRWLINEARHIFDQSEHGIDNQINMTIDDFYFCARNSQCNFIKSHGHCIEAMGADRPKMTLTTKTIEGIPLNPFRFTISAF